MGVVPTKAMSQSQTHEQLLREADKLLAGIEYRQATGSPYVHIRRPQAVDSHVAVPMLWHVKDQTRDEQEPVREGFRHVPDSNNKFHPNGQRVVQSRHRHSAPIKCLSWSGPGSARQPTARCWSGSLPSCTPGRSLSNTLCQYTIDESSAEHGDYKPASVRSTPDMWQGIPHIGRTTSDGPKVPGCLALRD